MMTTNNPYINLPDDGREITHIIYDKFGNPYTISGHLSTSGFVSDVVSELDWVGRINWMTEQADVLLITDLIIFDVPVLLTLQERVSRFIKRQPTHYKGRGLGSAMLNFIITSARAMGVSEINGWITGEDLEKTPYLPAFYRKHGFTVNDSDSAFYQLLD